MTQTTVDYLKLKETERHNKVTESETAMQNQRIYQLDVGKLNETQRANLKQETLKASEIQAKIANDIRTNQLNRDKLNEAILVDKHNINKDAAQISSKLMELAETERSNKVREHLQEMANLINATKNDKFRIGNDLVGYFEISGSSLAYGIANGVDLVSQISDYFKQQSNPKSEDTNNVDERGFSSRFGSNHAVRNNRSAGLGKTYSKPQFGRRTGKSVTKDDQYEKEKDETPSDFSNSYGPGIKGGNSNEDVSKQSGYSQKGGSPSPDSGSIRTGSSNGSTSRVIVSPGAGSGYSFGPGIK